MVAGHIILTPVVYVVLFSDTKDQVSAQYGSAQKTKTVGASFTIAGNDKIGNSKTQHPTPSTTSFPQSM
jgi:hypothetical protein